MLMRASHLRTIEFVYCAIVALWLVPQSHMGTYVGPLPTAIEAIIGLSVVAMLLLILKEAFYRDARRSGLMLLAATIVAYGVFSRSYQALIEAGVDYKLPYVMLACAQPLIAALGWLVAFAVWREKRHVESEAR